MQDCAVFETLEREKGSLFQLAQEIFLHPETAYNEVRASDAMARVLSGYGFSVERGCFGVKTALRASFGAGKPVIGLIGEMDALPGLSQAAVPERRPLIQGGPGHGCGHNLIAASAIAAAVALKEALTREKLPGTVVFYACPAEEVVTGKVYMARAGAFCELDAALKWHGDKANRVSLGRNNGVYSAVFHFRGKSAHAASAACHGRSALDAAELMNVGANYLREHVEDDVRIHYAYQDAGSPAPNVVPDYASVRYMVRAMSRGVLKAAYDRLVDVARGAALMTGTLLEVEFLGGCYETMPNAYLCSLAYDAMRQTPLPAWTEEELAFARTLNAACAPDGENAKPLADTVDPLEAVDNFGSTDLGDIQHIVPCMSIYTATYNSLAPGHSWQIAACAGMSIGEKGMLYGAKALALLGRWLLKEPRHIARAKAEFDENMRGRRYECALPEGVSAPEPAIRG